MITQHFSRRSLALFIGGCFAVSLFAAAASAQEEVVLFNGKDLSGWKFRNAKITDTWKVVSSVKLDEADPKKLVGTGEGGAADSIMFRQPTAHGTDIISEKEFGDCEVHVEFMVPKNSNSGVYLMGRYEIQVLSDTFGKQGKLGPGDMGGIYNTAAPTANPTKAPGEWQTFDVVFRAPRFDADGKKTENAKFVKVTLNGQVIHENVECKGRHGRADRAGCAEGPAVVPGRSRDRGVQERESEGDQVDCAARNVRRRRNHG